MSQELTIEGKLYISSKRASQISGYAQDYIGQLARKQLIDARRIGGLWYVFMDSLTRYKQQAEQYKPQPPMFVREEIPELSSSISFDGKEYLSAAHAAEQTGYHQDYVGQLARSGTILAKQIGNRWYVERSGLLEHKDRKDSMLAAVQSQAVGLAKQSGAPEYLDNAGYNEPEPMNYFSESNDLLPNLSGAEDQRREPAAASEETRLAIRTMTDQEARRALSVQERSVTAGAPRLAPQPKKSPLSKLSLAAGALATIVIVLTVGFGSIRSQSTYTMANRVKNAAQAISAASVIQGIADFIEQHFVPELTYRRG